MLATAKRLLVNVLSSKMTSQAALRAPGQTPEPNILAVDWAPGQTFTVKDDPDRTSSYTHQLPPDFPFQGWSNSDLTVEDVDTSKVSKNDARWGGPVFAKMVHGVLSPQECEAILGVANEKGFTPALVNVGFGRQKYIPEIRINQRCIIDDSKIADLLWQRLQGVLPNEWKERKAQSINERMRILCYHQPGDTFVSHYDGSFTRTDPDDPRHGETSFITLQLYLNEGFQGGHTSFIGADHERVVRIAPKQGSVLLFSQNLHHEGSKIKDGIKYSLRTEVMYAPSGKALQ